jgi:CRP-like cAMP-binding protein
VKDSQKVIARKPSPGLPRTGLRTESKGNIVRNALLLSAPDEEYARIRPHLELMALPHRHILHEGGDKFPFACFLNDGLVSLVVLTTDGRSVEVAVVGREGLIGMSLALGVNRGPYRAIVQIGGSGMCIRSEALADILPETPRLRLLLNRYILLQGFQVAQIAACNRLHSIEQRLARWLLMCQDRIDSFRLPVTHEFLAQMLGTGRPSISLAAGILQKEGMVENGRGWLKISDRKALEGAACECYLAMQRFSRSLGNE